MVSRFGMHQGHDGVQQRFIVPLLVDDLKSTIRALQENSVGLLGSPPIIEIETGWYATVRDPDGNLLQLSQRENG